MTFNAAPVVSVVKSSDREVRLVGRDRMLPFVLVTELFFLWAVPNNFNDILIRQFMKSFEINRLEAGVGNFVFFFGLFFLGFSGGVFLWRGGFKEGVGVWVGLYWGGWFLFFPVARVWEW